MSERLEPINYLTEAIPGISIYRARELARRPGFFPQGLIVRIGRKVYVNPKKVAEFIEAGGKALPGGWRRQA